MIRFHSISDLVALAEERRQPMSAIVQDFEIQRSQQSAQEIRNSMSASLRVMREAIAAGVRNREKSASGLTGGDAGLLMGYLATGRSLCGSSMGRAAAYALAVSEVNACMGRIVACPTAGSCGILPGALISVAESYNADDDAIMQGLFTAAGIGMVIAKNASISGAQGGCQAECGSAAAMAAGALVELAGGNPAQVSEALAMALKSVLGLVCDPVAGLVEVPCVKRNAFGAVQAVLAADMALAGIKSMIPADEVIEAMYKIGLALPVSLKETSQAGLAKTPTAKKIEKQLYGR